MAKKNKMEMAVDKIYGEYFSGVQVDIMALGSIFREIKAALISNSIETELPTIVARYRKN